MFGEDNIDAALEEAWVYRTVKDFEYIILSENYNHIDFTTILSNDAKKALLVMLKGDTNE
jgi:hypothetical protein